MEFGFNLCSNLPELRPPTNTRDCCLPVVLLSLSLVGRSLVPQPSFRPTPYDWRAGRETNEIKHSLKPPASLATCPIKWLWPTRLMSPQRRAARERKREREKETCLAEQTRNSKWRLLLGPTFSSVLLKLKIMGEEAFNFELEIEREREREGEE